MSITAKNKRILEDRRRREIMTAAKKLFYINGFTATTMNSIAEEAGISKGLIYHYFRNKQDLLLSFSDDVDDYLKELQEMYNPFDALHRFGVDFLVNDRGKFADAPPIQILLTSFADQVIDISSHEEKNPILRDFGREYLGGFFQKGINLGVFRGGNAKEYGDIYWSFLMGKLLPVKKGRESQEPEIYVDEILSVFTMKCRDKR